MNQRLLDHQKASAHYAWRKEINKTLPELASRVFALRQGGYSGSGFHYNMEKTLGRVIAMVNNYDDPLELHTPITDKVIYEGLIEDIQKAEWSLAHNGARADGPGAPWHETAKIQVDKAMGLLKALASGLETTNDNSINEFIEKWETLAEGDKQEFLKLSHTQFLMNVGGLTVDSSMIQEPVVLQMLNDAFADIEEAEFPRKDIAALVLAHGSKEITAKLHEAFPANGPKI